MLAWLITSRMLGAFAPVASTILDVMQVMVLRVIGHPCSQSPISMPEVVIGTGGIEGVMIRIE
jgi:hypothetical protein